MFDNNDNHRFSNYMQRNAEIIHRNIYNKDNGNETRRGDVKKDTPHVDMMDQ